MAGDNEEDKPIKLDNAGTLNQSVSTSSVLEKISLLPGHAADYSSATFVLGHEDHSLGNALRWMIMKDPDVEFCGYNQPHPSESKIHLRIQMYDNLSSVECLRKALGNLRGLLEAVDQKYGKSLRNDKYIKEEDVDVRAVVEQTLRERGRIPEDDSMDTS